MENGNTQQDTRVVRPKFKDFWQGSFISKKTLHFLLLHGVHYVHLLFEIDEHFPRGCGVS